MYKGQVVSHQKMKIIRYCYQDTKPSSHICIAHLKRSFNSTQSLQNNEIWSNLFCQKLGLDWTSVERPPLTEIKHQNIDSFKIVQGDLDVYGYCNPSSANAPLTSLGLLRVDTCLVSVPPVFAIKSLHRIYFDNLTQGYLY